MNPLEIIDNSEPIPLIRGWKSLEEFDIWFSNHVKETNIPNEIIDHLDRKSVV